MSNVAASARGRLRLPQTPFEWWIAALLVLGVAGRISFYLSPFGVPVGPAYRFAVYHLMPLAEPCEIFPMTIEEVK